MSFFLPAQALRGVPVHHATSERVSGFASQTRGLPRLFSYANTHTYAHERINRWTELHGDFFPRNAQPCWVFPIIPFPYRFSTNKGICASRARSLSIYLPSTRAGRVFPADTGVVPLYPLLTVSLPAFF